MRMKQLKQLKRKKQACLLLLCGFLFVQMHPVRGQSPGYLNGKAAIGGNTVVSGNLSNGTTGELYLYNSRLSLGGNYVGASGSKLCSAVTGGSNKGYLSVSGTATQSGGSTALELNLSSWDGTSVDLIEALDTGSDADAFSMTTTTVNGKTAALYSRVSGTKRIWYLAQGATGQLNLKLFLQGPMTSATEMSNLIQTHSGGELPGLHLPTQDPYGQGATYAQIDNINGPAGKVVDWIKVEIWGNVDVVNHTRTLLQTKALLLKTDGSVVDVDGQAPVFSSIGTSAVHIAVYHRNHLPVVSRAVTPVDGKISYDFTTAVSQALTTVDVSGPQLTSKSGVWALYGGDLADDIGSIDFLDNMSFSVDFGQQKAEEYLKSDLNMDGYVDFLDNQILKTNFGLNIDSSVKIFNSDN